MIIFMNRIYIIKNKGKELGFFFEIYQYNNDENPLRVLITSNHALNNKCLFSSEINNQRKIIP